MRVHLYMHSKRCWVVLTQIWVKHGLTQMLGLKCHLKFEPDFNFHFQL